MPVEKEQKATAEHRLYSHYDRKSQAKSQAVSAVVFQSLDGT
jgi:hypothetical protein